MVALGLISEPADEFARGSGSGEDVALGILEKTLVGGDVSAKTQALIREQMAEAEKNGTAPADRLSQMTALLMGSPWSFQVR